MLVSDVPRALPDIAIPHGNTISRTTDSTQSRRGTPPPPPPPVTTGGLNARSNDAAGSDPNVYVAQVRAERSGAFSVPTWLPGFHPFPTPTCTCLGESDGKLEDGLEPTESDETLLSIYRTRLSPQFPFVIIPNDLTANELQRSRPFLAKAIRMVASLRNRRFMWNQSRMLLRQISGSVFMRSDRSLDLLQGIIVFLGFYHYFCFAHGHFNNLAHLASSMVADMRLDRPRARELSRKRYLRGIDPEEPREMSNDERRAILVVWYINSRFVASHPILCENFYFSHDSRLNLAKFFFLALQWHSEKSTHRAGILPNTWRDSSTSCRRDASMRLTKSSHNLSVPSA
jgi:hypothetical protein